MTHKAYSRAVENFESLIAGIKNNNHARPGRLVHSAELAVSTGYRHVAVLEEEMMLRRDENGVYLPGLSSVRIGLSAFGMGHITPLVQPILLQLRQATQHTAFLAVSQNMQLSMGPHSMGRVTPVSFVNADYFYETMPNYSIGKIMETGLTTIDNTITRRISSLMMPVLTQANHIVLVGLLLANSQKARNVLEDSLHGAFEQIKSVTMKSK